MPRISTLILLFSLCFIIVSARPHYRIHVFKTGAGKENVGYGYDILNGGKPFIHQTSVPAIAGNEPFKTRKHAKRVARLVRKKLVQGIMPPTVTTAELQELGVIGK